MVCMNSNHIMQYPGWLLPQYIFLGPSTNCSKTRRQYAHTQSKHSMICSGGEILTILTCGMYAGGKQINASTLAAVTCFDPILYAPYWHFAKFLQWYVRSSSSAIMNFVPTLALAYHDLILYFPMHSLNC